LLRSEEFDNAVWGKTASSITANTTTSPDGTANADTYLQNASGFSRLTSPTFTFIANTDYTLSLYLKNIDAVRFSIVMLSDLSTSSWFNLETYTLESSSGSMSEAKIISVGNNWYRLTAKITYAITTDTAFYYRLSTSTSVNSIDFSKSVYLWGAQLELGAYPTSYIPTTTAAVTRIADAFSRNNIFTNGLITSSGGTWFVEFRNNVAYQRDANNGVFLGENTFINSGNQLTIRNGVLNGAVRLSIFKYISGVGTPLFTTATNTVKIAIKWNGTSADVFVNGIKEVSATAFTATNMENLIGNGASVPLFIQQMALYPSPIPDTDCQLLTTL
jgi:hypothetical protein